MGFIITYAMVADALIRRVVLFLDVDAMGFLPLELLDRVLYLIYGPLLPDDWDV